MSPVSNISPVKSAFAFAAILSLAVAGLSIRGAASADVPTLGIVDDYATRHAVDAAIALTTADDFGTRNQAAKAELTTADDFGTRNQAAKAELTTADDFGTRNQAAKAELTTADDFGTRHGAPAINLGPNDDYATRQGR